MLHLMNVKQSLTDGLICQRRRMRLKGSPVLGIGPFLVRIEFVEIGAHRFLHPSRESTLARGQFVSSITAYNKPFVSLESSLLWREPPNTNYSLRAACHG